MNNNNNSSPILQYSVHISLRILDTQQNQIRTLIHDTQMEFMYVLGYCTWQLHLKKPANNALFTLFKLTSS